MASLSRASRVVVDLAAPKTVQSVQTAAAAVAAAAGLTLHYKPTARCYSDYVDYTSTLGAVDKFPIQVKKEYKIQQKSWTSMLNPKTLFLLLLRSSAINFLPVLEQYAKDLEKLDELDDGTGEQEIFPPVPDLKPAARKTLLSILRDLIVMTTRRIIERTSELTLPRRWTWKLMKNVQDSAIRKYRRGIIGMSLCGKMIQTCFVGHSITVLSEFTVAESMILYKLLYIKPESRQAKESLRREMMFTALRCSFSLCGAGLGAGIGSAIKPGIGTFIGLNGGDILASIFVLSTVRKWLEQGRGGNAS